MKKSDLLEALETSHENILTLIEGVPVEVLTQPGATGEWSVKDLLSHLLIWEAETIKLLYQAHLHRKPDTAHFKTISDDEQNKIWLAQFKDRPYERVWNDYATIRDQTIERLSEISDANLNNSTFYPWLKGGTLAELIQSFILQHEAEHTQTIQNWLNKQSKP
ncbi:MAG TPA: ClbS/DfsB family four-helix bundle protein [Bellilinea sp.]|nr:ClbS/DfsB family four-helix bundle protein [Bellilinea sp.]